MRKRKAPAPRTWLAWAVIGRDGTFQFIGRLKRDAVEFAAFDERVARVQITEIKRGAE